MAICYFGSNIEVCLGDRVEIKVWFRRRTGRVSYLPGTSPQNGEFEHNGLRWVAIRTEKMIVGTLVNPHTEALKKNVRFMSRDESTFEAPPDDPQYYAEHGGGFSP
jgi:hypothetical protein